jgi:hypothetical protein
MRSGKKWLRRRVSRLRAGYDCGVGVHALWASAAQAHWLKSAGWDIGAAVSLSGRKRPDRKWGNSAALVRFESLRCNGVKLSARYALGWDAV